LYTVFFISHNKNLISFFRYGALRAVCTNVDPTLSQINITSGLNGEENWTKK